VRCGALALLTLSLGCTGTTLRSGTPPGVAPSDYDRRWHSSFLFGALDIHGPYALSRICPKGWSEVQVGPDEFTILAGLFTLFIYSPSRVTVVCTAVPGTSPPELPQLSTFTR
jgi:hypothetical protein